MESANHDSDKTFIGDNIFFVFGAYFLVFLPWGIVQAIDFIGPEWKTVNKTWRNGWIQFVITLFPIGVIAAYIVFQGKANDYKEMAAAFVALVFACIHLVHTAWGLWQIALYRRWAANSIRTLHSQGVRYQMHLPDEEEMSCYEKAGYIKINESIVDNQVGAGATRCFLVWDARCPVFWKRLLQKPYEPVEVWINWATAFVAQGMGEWVQNFDCATDPGLLSECTKSATYRERYIYFAKELLTSAVLLSRPAKRSRECRPSYGKGHPLQWSDKTFPENVESDGSEEDPKKHSPSSFEGKGLLSRRGMLHHALIDGNGLPFDAPQAAFEAEEGVKALKFGEGYTEEVVQNLLNFGYSPYSYDIKQAAASMPAKFGNDINKFRYEMLECLAILLNLGESNSGGDHASALYKDNRSNDNDEHLTDDNVPVKNLKTQLGLTGEMSLDSNAMLVQTAKSALRSRFCGLVFPVVQRDIIGTFHGNRSVLAVSGLIDIWNALNAGDSMHFVLENNEVCKLEYRPAVIPLETVKRHSALERIRLEAEFGIGGANEYHMDQRVVFLGVAMESVRTALMIGDRGDSAMRAADRNWEPPVAFSSSQSVKQEGVKKEVSITVTVSRALHCALRAIQESETSLKMSILRRRPLHCAIVSELQAACYDQIRDGVDPDDRIAMIACMLAFPSLRFQEEKVERRIVAEITSNEKDSIVKFAPRHIAAAGAENEGSSADVEVLCIKPVGGPQDFFIEVDIDLDESGTDIRLILHGNTGNIFNWSGWRDAFDGRLQGKRIWLENHGVEVCKEYVNGCKISDGSVRPLVVQAARMGLGKEVTVWNGWLPSRLIVCKLEILSENLIPNTGEVRSFAPTAFSNYYDANRDDLDYATAAVQNELQNFINNPVLSTTTFAEENGEGTSSVEMQEMDSDEYEIIRLLRLEDPPELWNSEEHKAKDAVRVFELAAGDGSVAGLQHAIDVIVNERQSPENVEKGRSCLRRFCNFAEPGKFQKIQNCLMKLVRFSNYDPSTVYEYINLYYRFEGRDILDVIICEESTLLTLLRCTFVRYGSWCDLEGLILVLLRIIAQRSKEDATQSEENDRNRDDQLDIYSQSGKGVWMLVALLQRLSNMKNIEGGCCKAILSRYSGSGLLTLNGGLLNTLLHATGNGSTELMWLKGILHHMLDGKNEFTFGDIVDGIADFLREGPEQFSASGRSVHDMVSLQRQVKTILQDASTCSEKYAGNRVTQASKILGTLFLDEGDNNITDALNEFEKVALLGNLSCIEQIEKYANEGPESSRLHAVGILLNLAENSPTDDYDRHERSIIFVAIPSMMAATLPLPSDSVDRCIIVLAKAFEKDSRFCLHAGQLMKTIIGNGALPVRGRRRALEIVRKREKRAGRALKNHGDEEITLLLAVLLVEGAEPILEPDAVEAKKLFAKLLKFNFYWPLVNENFRRTTWKFIDMLNNGSGGVAQDSSFAHKLSTAVGRRPTSSSASRDASAGPSAVQSNESNAGEWDGELDISAQSRESTDPLEDESSSSDTSRGNSSAHAGSEQVVSPGST